jgi:hypothetical protein
LNAQRARRARGGGRWGADGLRKAWRILDSNFERRCREQSGRERERERERERGGRRLEQSDEARRFHGVLFGPVLSAGAEAVIFTFVTFVMNLRL